MRLQIKLLNIAPSPHWRYGGSLATTQQLRLVALLPTLVAGAWYFGINSLRILGLSIACAVAVDALVNRLAPSKDLTTNWSSVTLAVIFALMLPFDAPWWLVVVGSSFMIVVGKKLYGGFGAYPVHPALLAYAVLIVSWPSRFDFTRALLPVDLGVTMIEPIRLARTLGAVAEQSFRPVDLLLGRQVAGIGSAMPLFLLIGGLFLIATRQIRWHIPVAFLAGNAAVAGFLSWIDPGQFASPTFYLLSGGTVFAAFFLATEPTTSPVNPIPMVIYGLLGGVLLMLIRAFSSHGDGIVFTILLINLCNPLIDRIRPRVLGLEEPSHA